MSKKKEEKDAPIATEKNIVKAETTALSAADEEVVSLLRNWNIEDNDLFIQKYKGKVESLVKSFPSKTQLQKILDGIDDDHIDQVSTLLKQFAPEQKGVYADDEGVMFPEIRLYHGVGNDPNRPSNCIPGHFYLSTKETVGQSFEATPIAVWAGRSMWPPQGEEGPKGPICQSMDRLVGTNFGSCEECPNRPWRDNKKQACQDDVVAFMLTRDMKDIILVRFQKTSVNAGKQLIRYIRRSYVPWGKWYTVKSEETISPNNNKFRYFVMKVEPSAEETLVPEPVQDFCEALCSMAERDYILPKMANVYFQAQDTLESLNDDSVEDMEAKPGEAPATEDTPNYDTFDGDDA